LAPPYGELAVAVRNASATVFDWIDDAEARAVVARIGASDDALAARIAGRGVRTVTAARTSGEGQGSTRAHAHHERLTMTYIALAAIAAGLVLFDRLCPALQRSGSPYNWPTPLRVLTFTSVALIIWGTITVSIFPALG
jgi:hypothetical protein